MDRNDVLQEIEDLKITCSHEKNKILVGLLFILISGYGLFSLTTSPPLTKEDWPVFTFFFSLMFTLLIFGLNYLFTALTSSAAKNQRNHDELNRKLDQLLQARVQNMPNGSTEEPQHQNENDVLIAIRDNSKNILEYLKNPNKEDRALVYSNTILAYVAAIVALTALGKDMYIQSGLPLQPLWIGLLCLLLGGIFTIYYDYSKWTPALLVIGVSVIGILYVGFVILTIMLSGVHVAPPTTGNVTNICENCTYPVTNTVNNYNITVIENCTTQKSSMVSVEELSYLMGSHR
jgi:hypothetical protein